MRKLMLAMIATASLAVAGCNPTTSASTTQRQEQARDQAASAADHSVPAYQATNFVVRQTINEYMRRMDEPNKIFYLYVISDLGTAIGYYVARTPPVNICTFMTPPERVERHKRAAESQSTFLLRQAPALDGVFYGSGACSTEYFLDAETDALIMIQGLNLFVSDQPIQNIDAPQFVMQTNN